MDRFPQLYTPRLLLRQLSSEDVPDLIKYADDKSVGDHIVNIPYPFREYDAVARLMQVYEGFKAKSRYSFAVILKDVDGFVGECTMNIENPTTGQLGYWLGAPFRGRGLTSEAVGAVLRFGFEKLGLESVFATCHPDNPASAAVLIRNGLTFQNDHGGLQVFEIIASDFQHNQTLSH